MFKESYAYQQVPQLQNEDEYELDTAEVHIPDSVQYEHAPCRYNRRFYQKKQLLQRLESGCFNLCHYILPNRMVTHHKRLQHYKRHYGMVCLTGMFGCRWHRYQQSTDDTPKVGLYWLTVTFSI